jgi:hypothetical protein
MTPAGSKLPGYIYLLLVPVLTAALGFGVGHVSYKIYLPVWILNVALMISSCWLLGLHIIRSDKGAQSKLARSAFFLIVPWILVSLFAGLGPPPETASGWTETAREQQVRYFLLVVSGLFIAFGFSGVANELKNKGEDFYSRLGLLAILIAIPLFIINMLYWGFYLTEMFRIQHDSHSTAFPEWFLPIRQLFGLLSLVEVALTYFATFAIAISLQRAGWLSRKPSLIYMTLSLLALFVILLSVFFPEALKIPSFALSIPAFPFLMPYYMGVNLLRKAGS